MLISKGISEGPQLKVGLIHELLVLHMLMNDSIYQCGQRVFRNTKTCAVERSKRLGASSRCGANNGPSKRTGIVKHQLLVSLLVPKSMKEPRGSD